MDVHEFAEEVELIGDIVVVGWHKAKLRDRRDSEFGKGRRWKPALVVGLRTKRKVPNCFGQGGSETRWSQPSVAKVAPEEERGEAAPTKGQTKKEKSRIASGLRYFLLYEETISS